MVIPLLARKRELPATQTVDKLTFSLGEALKYVKDNSDTWLGFAVWSVRQLLAVCLSKLKCRLVVSIPAMSYRSLPKEALTMIFSSWLYNRTYRGKLADLCTQTTS